MDEQAGRRQALRERILSFPRWHYEFELDGITTPIFDADHVNRHRQRRSYLLPPLLAACGGTLQGKRVLDLGCNAGFWSLECINAGCDFVLGIDGRQVHVDQANLVFEVRGVDDHRYQFVRGNVNDIDLTAWGSFDVVLCLGLLYHVCKPVELLERIAAANSDILLIDTALSLAPGSWLKLERDHTEELAAALDYEIVFFPSRRAVLDLVEQAGYRSVVLRPEVADPTGMTDYLRGARRAFLCAKRTDLWALDLPRDREEAPSRWESLAFRSAHRWRRLTHAVKRRGG